MNVLFIGIPGIQRRTALSSILAAAEKEFPRERIYTVDRQQENGAVSPTIPILEDLLYSGNPGTLLTKHAHDQRVEWRKALKDIENGYRKSHETHFFLAAHLQYRYGQVEAVVADLHELARLRPDCIVTLTDDIYCVRERIHRGRHTSFTLQDILSWRSHELLLGDVLARLVSNKTPPPNYLMSVRHPVQKLVRMIFSHDKAAKRPVQSHGRVYLSYNISDTRHDPEGRAEIDQYRARFHALENLFVFDPLMIDELPPVYHLRKLVAQGSDLHGQFEYDPREARWRWPWLTGAAGLAPIVDDSDLLASYPLKVPYAELLAAADVIDAQVSDRDIRLVDQAHHLGLWRPTMTRGTAISSGVRGEMEFARNRGVRLHAYMKLGVDELPTSSFLRYIWPAQNTDSFFDATDEAFWRNISNLNAGDHSRDRDHFLR